MLLNEALARDRTSEANLKSLARPYAGRLELLPRSHRRERSCVPHLAFPSVRVLPPLFSVAAGRPGTVRLLFP